MNEPPRPSSLGEILDRTAQIYRSRFWAFFGIAVVPTALVLVFASGIFLFVAWSGPKNSAIAGTLALAFFGAIALVVLPTFLGVNALAAAAMNHAVSRTWQGEKISIRDAYKAIWPRGWHYLWLYVLESLILLAAPVAAWLAVIIPMAMWSTKAGHSTDLLLGLTAILLAVIFAGYAIWMLLRLSLAFPACVVEQGSAWASIKRSSSLSQGTRGRIFVLYLLGTVLNYLLSLAITVPVLIIMALVPGVNSPQHAQTTGMVVMFLMYGAAFAVQAFTRPVYGIALVLFYYDQRMRKEGFDIDWMMQQAGLIVPAAPQPEAQPWLPPIPHKQANEEPIVPPASPESPSISASEPTSELASADPATSEAGEPV